MIGLAVWISACGGRAITNSEPPGGDDPIPPTLGTGGGAPAPVTIVSPPSNTVGQGGAGGGSMGPSAGASGQTSVFDSGAPLLHDASDQVDASGAIRINPDAGRPPTLASCR